MSDISYVIANKLIALVAMSVLFVGTSKAQLVYRNDSDEGVCYERLARRPEFQSLHGGFKQKDDAPIFLKYANVNRANEQEKRLIAEYANSVQSCYEKGAEFRASNFPPIMQAIAEEGFRKYLMLVAQVYNRELSYGDYHRQKDQISSEIRARVARFETDEENSSAEIAQQKLSVEQARQNAVNAAIVGSAVQGVRDSIKPPVKTDCYRFGNGVSCQTR